MAEITPKSKKEKLGYFNLITETIGLMIYQISTLTLQNYQPDVVINISRQACGNFDFYRTEELIEIGKNATIKGLEEFQKKNNIAFREDSSNSSLKYSRNKIRHVLIPELEDLNPNFKNNLLETISYTSDATEIFIESIEEKKKKILSFLA